LGEEKEKATMAKNLNRDLQDVSNELRELAKKVEKLQKQSPAAKAPKKAKKTIKKKVVKRASASATSTVLAVVRRSKKGVSPADVISKTGFDQKKVANTLYELKKRGQIKNVTRGIYIKP
jgi:predicted Rossmann fold nucleotide-binding protein DprA/Smf involved in DNA uptake